MGGDALVLQAGINLQLTGEYGASVTISLQKITLAADQAFQYSNLSLLSRVTLNIQSPVVDLQGFTLTLIGGPFGPSGLSGDVGTLASAVEGSGGLVKSGPSKWELSGTSSYTGQTIVSDGPLGIRSNLALGSSDAGTVVEDGATLLLSGDEVTSLAEPVVLDDTSATAVDGAFAAPTLLGPVSLQSSSVVHNVVLGGTVNLNGFNLVLVTDGDSLNEVTGVVQGPGNVIVAGDTTAFGSPENGNGLGGTGILNGSLLMNEGTLVPGTSTPGVLTVGSVAFQPGTIFQPLLNGTTPGSSYSQLHVTGTANLGGATLLPVLNFTPADGDFFVIVQAMGPLSGTFSDLNGAALTDGSVFTIAGRPFVINYEATAAGSEVVLTAAPSTRKNRIWTGANHGTDVNWTDAANWEGGVAPNPGDDLVFPASAASLLSNNDFQPGTSFDAITFTGQGGFQQGYQLIGNVLILGNGIRDEQTGSNGFAPVATLNFATPGLSGITLSGDQIFSTGPYGAAFIVSSSLNLQTFQLTLDNDLASTNQPSLSGTITGNGRLVKTGADSWQIAADNGAAFTGSTLIQDGILVAGPLGPGRITVQPGGGLGTTSGGTISSPITVSGDGPKAVYLGALQGVFHGALEGTFSGPISLSGETEVAATLEQFQC